MLVKRIAACIQYPSAIFNRFPVIQPVCSKVRQILAHFCTFWPPLGTPLGQSRLMLNEWKEDSMLVKRIIYPSIFNRFPVTVIQPVSSKVRHFSTFLHILPPLGTPLGQ